MKFAHLSDIHIGGWREDSLRQLGIEAFRQAMQICIEKNIGFILIAGDLFNTSLPSIESLKEVSSILSKVKDHDINVYVIPGSHDFSASGKTMLDVLEHSGLIENVVKFKENKLQFAIDKTGAKITGLYGKKGGLDIFDYEKLEKYHLESEPGFKIFMFHSLLDEFKPKGLEIVDAMSINQLPKNFNYYAGGHPHFVFQKKLNNSLLTYPGALFPNNFKELEEFKYGGFYILDEKLNYECIPVKIKDVLSINIDADDKTPEQIENELLNKINNHQDKIVLIRISGLLSSGKPSDINFKSIQEKFKDAYYILRNTNKLLSKEFDISKVETRNVTEIESTIITENLGKIKVENLNKDLEFSLAKSLIDVFSIEKDEGETNNDFEIRLKEDVKKALAIEI